MPGVASAGGSSGRDLAVNADADGTPSAGTTQNGYAPASFSSESLETEVGDTMSTFFTASAGTLLLCAYVPVAGASSGPFTEGAFVADRGGVLVASFSTAGVGVGIFDGAQKTQTLACSTAAYHQIAMRWDNSNLKLRVDQTDAANVAAGTITSMTGRVVFAKNPGIAFLNYRLLDAATYASAVSDAKLDEWREYYNTRYALSL